MRITTLQLIHLLTTGPTGAARGNNFVTLTARSPASSIRKNGMIGDTAVINRYYKNLTHLYTINVQTGFDTQKRVNKLRAKAGEESREIGAPVNGHVKVAPQVVRQRNGNIGLACEVLKWVSSVYTCTTTGETVTSDYLAPFKRPDDRDIDYLTPNLCNVDSVTIDGATYEIDHDDYESVMITLAPSLPMLDDAPSLNSVMA